MFSREKNYDQICLLGTDVSTNKAVAQKLFKKLVSKKNNIIRFFQLAEKRKQMLDEFSIDQQKVVAEHKEQLERLESSYKDEARKSQDEFKVL